MQDYDGVIEGGMREESDLGASSSQIKGDTMDWRGVGFDSGSPGSGARTSESQTGVTGLGRLRKPTTGVTTCYQEILWLMTGPEVVAFL